MECLKSAHMTQRWKLSRWSRENVPVILLGLINKSIPEGKKGFRVSPTERSKEKVEADAVIFSGLQC